MYFNILCKVYPLQYLDLRKKSFNNYKVLFFFLTVNKVSLFTQVMQREHSGKPFILHYL